MGDLWYDMGANPGIFLWLSWCRVKRVPFNFCMVARCTFIRELAFASVYKQVQNCEDASEKEEWKI